MTCINNKKIQNVKSTIILPIYTEHVKKIYTGHKFIELRHRIVSDDADSILFYENAPISKITGLVSIYKTFEGNISELGETKFSDNLFYAACINKEWFKNYYKKRNKYFGYFLNTDNSYIFDNGLGLEFFKLNTSKIQKGFLLESNHMKLLNYLIRNNY